VLRSISQNDTITIITAPKVAKKFTQLKKFIKHLKGSWVQSYLKRKSWNYTNRFLNLFFGQSNEARLSKIKKIQAEIQKNKERIDTAMRMMLDSAIDPSEYKIIKGKYEEMNTTLLRDRASLEIDKVNYSSKIQGCFNLLMHLDKFYAEASVDIKQKIVCLNFPEKLIYENGQFQTPKMNEVLSLIMLENK
jgi:hypothetical protein